MPSRIFLPVLLAVLGALAPAPVAGAAKGKKPPKPVVTAMATQSSSAQNELLTVRVDCPKGRTAVGGGFTAPTIGAPAITDFHIIYESRRSNAFEPQGWTVKAARGDGATLGNALPVTAYALCSTRKVKFKGRKTKLTILERTATSPATGTSGQTSASGLCPDAAKPLPGYNALGGGFITLPAPLLSGPGGGLAIVWRSAATAVNAWTSSMTVSGAADRTIVSAAYCVPRRAPAVRAGVMSLPPSIGTTTSFVTAATPACSRKRPLAGGGFDFSPAASGSVVPIITESAPSGRTWRTSAFNLSTTTGGTVGALAYCL